MENTLNQETDMNTQEQPVAKIVLITENFFGISDGKGNNVHGFNGHDNHSGIYPTSAYREIMRDLIGGGFKIETTMS